MPLKTLAFRARLLRQQPWHGWPEHDHKRSVYEHAQHQSGSRSQMRDPASPACDFGAVTVSGTISGHKQSAPQDALSAMYTLMARYGRSSICGATGGSQALLAAARCAIAALRGVHLLRDAASSAAIMLWAAVALPDVSDAEAARMLAQGLCSAEGAMPVAAGGYSQRGRSFVESQWLQEVRFVRIVTRDAPNSLGKHLMAKARHIRC